MLPSLVKHALYPLHEALLRRPTFRQVADLERLPNSLATGARKTLEISSR